MRGLNELMNNGHESMATECALLVAENILDEYSRDDALERIAQIWSSAGLTEQARNAVARISDPGHRIWALAQTAYFGTFPGEALDKAKTAVYQEALIQAAHLPEAFSRGWILNKINLFANRSDISWDPSRWFAATAATACQIHDASSKCKLMAEIIGAIAETWACSNAWEVLDICLEASESDIGREERAGLIAGAAGAYHASGNQAYARELFFKALAITEAIENPSDRVWVTGCIAEIFHQNGDASLAREVLDYGCGLIDTIQEDSEAAWLMGAFGSLYSETGLKEKAITQFERSFRRAMEIEDAHIQGHTLLRITDFYVSTDLIDKSLNLPGTLELSQKLAEAVNSLDFQNEPTAVPSPQEELANRQAAKVVALAEIAAENNCGPQKGRRGTHGPQTGTNESPLRRMEKILSVLAG